VSAATSADMMEIGQSEDNYQERLRRTIRRAAVGFAVIALVATSGFFIANSYQAERWHVRSEAARAADQISMRIRQDPEGWRRDVRWLDNTINGLHGPGEESWHEVIDSSGALITRFGGVPSLTSVVGEAPIRYDGQVVAVVRIGQFPHRASEFTALGLALGLILSGCVIVVLWVLPMRVLDAAFGRVEGYRGALEARVGELEHTQDLLRQQGAELSQVAERLYNAREKEHKANVAKSEFLANMSHELRTPLNTIIGFTEIMELGSFGSIGNPRYAEYLGHIHASGNHLLELINDMLDLAKVEAGKLELEEQEVDFGHLVHRCRNLLEQRIGGGGLEFEAHIPEHLPMLMADDRKLLQILLNLLSNAIKHTPSGGRIAVRAWLDAPGLFNFSVTDTGVGMAPEDIPRALEPFGQLHNPMVAGEKGTGLGLSLTKVLVELHGGTIALDSEPGKGTKARVRLPAERVLDRPELSH